MELEIVFSVHHLFYQISLSLHTMIRNVIMKALYLGLFLIGSHLPSVQAQEVAPKDIPLPWYSQKISGCPYAHCSLASSLMVFDYYKGMTVDSCRSAAEAEAKLVEYQKNYFLKKRAPFKRRTSILFF